MFMSIVGHQASLSYGSESGKPYSLYVDPDYSWYENAGEYVVEETGSDSIVLRDRRSGERKVLPRREVEIIEYSQDRGY